MASLHAARALMPEGWRHNVRLSLADGQIAGIEADTPPKPGDEHHDILLPTMPNLHSHAFQRGMAGLAELRGPGTDTFWSWRTVMYRFALTMTPDQMQAIAAQLYVEMLEAGFGRVGEFHYLHHDRDGTPYGNLAEMAERIAAAAGDTGIALTLLPVFYAHANFGGTAPVEGQRRFITDPDRFARLFEGSRAAIVGLSGARLGVAPHSLRAVTPAELELVTALCPTGPIHIHAAEQVREVEDCVTWSGARPVDWLLNHASVDRRWCLIHATHMSPDETRRLAASGAVAGLCPVTEANLGDGIFPGRTFTDAGGRFGIGSDSNVLIGLSDELRQLEYAQRLGARERNVLAPAGGSTGRALFDAALAGGAQALDAPAGLSAGLPADLVSLRPRHDTGIDGDALLDSLIFANGLQVEDVWVGGRKLVEGGRHIRREAIAKAFSTAMRELAA